MYTLLIIYTIILSLIMAIFRKKEKNIYLKFMQKRRKISRDLIWVVLFCIPFIFLFINRSYEVGTDTRSIYYDIYYGGYAVSLWKAPVYEGLFIQYIRVLYRIVPQFRFFLFVTSLIICVTFIYYFVRQRSSINATITILTFLVWIYAPSLNIMRQLLAVTICFWGLLQLEKKNIVLAGSLFAIAMFFHITSIVMFVYFIPYFLGEKQKWRKKIPLIFMLSPIAIFLLGEMVVKIPIFSKFYGSIHTFDFANVNQKFFLFPLLMMPLVVCFWNQLVKASEYNYIHLCGTILIFPAVLLSGYLWYAFRMFYFFVPSGAIVLGQIGRCCKNGIQKFMVNLYIVVCTVLMFYLLYVYFGTDKIYPFLFNNLK